MAIIERIGCRYATGVTWPSVSSTAVYATSAYDSGGSGSSVSIRWGKGSIQLLRLTDSCSISFDPSSIGVGTYILHLVQLNGGGHIITWPKDIKWAFGQIPQLSTYENSESMVSFKYLGSVFGWYGQAIHSFSTVAD